MLILSLAIVVIMKPETSLGLLKGVQSFLSLVILLSFLQIVSGKGATLIEGSDGPLLFLPWVGGIMLFVTASVAFWVVYAKSRKVRIDDISAIETEFPITKTSALMAKEIERLNKTVDRLDFVASLTLGWTLVLVPFYLVFVLLWLVSLFTDSVNVLVNGSWRDALGGIMVWGIANLLFLLIFNLYRIGRRLARYSEILAKLDPELL